MKYTSVIFDLDGTLCDTLRDIHASVNRTLAALGYPERSFEHTRGGINRGSRHLIAHALPDDADEGTVMETLALYMKIYGEHLCDETVPYPGITPMLARLNAENIKLAVLSNKPDPLVKRLAEHCFPGIFDIAMGQGEYPVKPEPTAPLAIACTLGVSTETVLFVGDSDVDVLTAHNAGMTAVGVTWGYRDRDVLVSAGADHIISHPSEIYDIIKS